MGTIRMIFAIVCVMAGTVIGLYRSAELKKRERLLSEMVRLLEKMSVQIRYRALPLGDLFDTLKGDDFINAVLEQSKSETVQNPNWHDAWNNAVNGFPELDEGDKELLKSVGNSLGGSDTAGQTAMLELNRELLANRLRGASENFSKKGAMYRSVGLLTGLGLAVIII